MNVKESKMPIREFICKDCGHIEEALVRYPGDEPIECAHCQCRILHILPSYPGGYTISGNNGASTTPKSAGSFKRKK